MPNKTVVVGMSGGVDSSVAALLLKKQGYRVIGLFMKNWEEKDDSGNCHAAADSEDASQVCQKLEIPFYTVNFTQEYWDHVFTHFLQELKQGRTPNPDILCNREIKFKHFFAKAKELKADYLATGHYCQTNPQGELFKGMDSLKDQSYFLHAVPGSIFQEVLFPIGHLAKGEVRRLAKEAGLATAEKKDSTGICFIGKRDFRSFISNYLPYQPGLFQTLEGKVVGEHSGSAYYTIGQRKGLAIGGAGEAWFVVGKDMDRNLVFVVQGQDHPALYASSLIAREPYWIQAPPEFPLRCTAKIRYRQEDQWCHVIRERDHLQVQFDQPQRAITAGQSIVFYEKSRCLGGATIT